jgi:hypothetical protein
LTRDEDSPCRLVAGLSSAVADAFKRLNDQMNLIPKPVVALLWTSLILSVVPLRGAVVTANFTSATTVPVTAASYTATGNTVDFTLNFAPPAGTDLMVVKNTGTAPIQGVFANLAQGQLVQLTDGGVSYSFTVNYFGGTGNDLVLQWANTRLLAWGNASNGKLGNNSSTFSSVPVLVNTGALKPGERFAPRSQVAGDAHTLAVVVSPPPPAAATGAATGISDTAATLNGSVNPSGTSTAVSFEYGLTTNYGATVAASPPSITGTEMAAVSATLTDLRSGTTYHYRLVADGPGGHVLQVKVGLELGRASGGTAMLRFGANLTRMGCGGAIMSWPCVRTAPWPHGAPTIPEG